MVSFDPNRPDFAPYGLTCVRWTAAPMQRPDHHDEIEMNLLESGSITYLMGGRRARVEAGQLSVFWGAIPHQIIEIGTTSAYFVGTIPLGWFLQYRLPEHFVQPLLQGRMLRAAAPARQTPDARLFAQWESDLKAAPSSRADIVLLEMKARLLRLADQVAPRDRRGARPRAGLREGALNNVERMACLIARRYTEPLAIADIGRAVNLHPNYAMALFRRAFGTTLIDSLTHHRVSHAQRLLVTGEDKIVNVAFASGFNSISRFNEAFRRICGCSPRDYRRRHLALD